MRLLSVQSSLPAPVRRITSAEPLPAKAALQLVFLRARRTLKGEFSARLGRARMLIWGATLATRQRLALWLRAPAATDADDRRVRRCGAPEGLRRRGRGVSMTPVALKEETRAEYAIEVIGRGAELIADEVAQAEARLEGDGQAVR